MTIHSYAKLNLGLKVLGKRADGFHDLLSIFQEVDLQDDLHIDVDPGGDLSVIADRDDVPDGPGNLVYRAADALRLRAKRPDLGALVRITKRIPSRGGLGGGSSNAGAVLCALNHAWNLRLPEADLAAIGGEIGSDVPFSVGGGTALVTGRGEEVQPLKIVGDSPTYLLVDPGFSVETAWAFGSVNIKLTSECPYIRFLNSVRASGEVALLDFLETVENDFLPLICARYPSVQRILSTLEDSGALGASMSGTGATLYGGFSDPQIAEQASLILERLGYVTHLCTPVRRPGGSPTPKQGCRVV